MKISTQLLSMILAALTAWPAFAIVAANRDAAPYASHVVALLTRGPQGSGYCTAVVLSSDRLLTAAHCLRPAADMMAMSRDAAGGIAFLPVTDARAHPRYRPDAVRRREVSVDVAIVQLARPLPAFYSPIRLASGDPPAQGETVTAVGFGLGEEGRPRSGGPLRAVGLTVSEPRSAVLIWAKGSNGAGACSGDSGGPIFDAHGDLTALVAWTRGAGGRLCGVLTQGPWLAPIQQWIEEK